MSRAVALLAVLALGFTAVTSGEQVSVQATAITGQQAPSSSARAAAVRPNIVWVVVDDMREDDLQYMPRTRRLLGSSGVRFVNSFSPNPVCCPARASYFTGQYSHSHGVLAVRRPWGFNSFDDRSTLPTWLRAAGYNTLYLGKYLNGYGSHPEPGKTTGRSVRYKPPGWTRWHASIDGGLPKTHRKDGGTYRYMNTTLSNNGDGFLNYKGQYQTDVYKRLSADLIRTWSNRRKPFFLFVSYTAPHNGGPQEKDDLKYVVDDQGRTVTFGSPAVPDRVRGMYDDVITAAPGAGWQDPDPSDKPLHLRSLEPPNEAELAAMVELTRQRAEALEVVDQAVQRKVRVLRKVGVLDRTLVVFTSDNGYYLGEQHIRQGKILPHEPSLRTPTLVRGPGIPRGEVRHDPITSLDFAPTLVDAAGARPGLVMDGESLWPTLVGGDRGWRRGLLTETGPREIVRDTDVSGQPLRVVDPGARDLRWAIGVRTARYLYVDLASGEEELYDVLEDPDQYHNLAGLPEHAEVLTQLRQALRQLRACAGDGCRVPLPHELTAEPVT
jgi:N-acetylglucosamine-6-sulfatase